MSEMIDRTTIFALSTGIGRAGIAVVRLSGPRSSIALETLAGELPNPKHLAYRKIRDPQSGDVLDAGFVVWLPGPGTATGEDMAEFHLHGSPAVVQSVLAALGGLEGLKLAEAGEFTRRAFANDKLDLVEVEGLADLLAAESEPQRRLAMRQFLGEASSAYERWRSELIAALAMIEASIDFVDEAGVAEQARAQVMPRIDKLIADLNEALSRASSAGLVRAGLKLVIAGPPNVGKSSLLNWLAAREAAIVSPIAGTTRDVIEARVSIAGFPVLVSDTAGLRDASGSEIEEIGIGKAKAEITDADVLVWMTAVDVASDVQPGRTPDISVVNKIDISESIQTRNDHFAVSIRTKNGLDELAKALEHAVRSRASMAEDALVVRERHRLAVEESIRLLNDVKNTNEMPLELMAEKMRGAAHALASITGRVDAEDLLGQIFSEFCIGK
jgi:tRNA modification GTPase